MAQQFPKIEIPENLYLVLANAVAKTSWLPHPDTVKELNGAAFPTIRQRAKNPRLTRIMESGKAIGMYDDNATPEWALVWAHEIIGSRPKGWTIAHVWPVTDCIHSYTHLANLVLVPECFGSLTDKVGPLTQFLRWHSWQVYGWKPKMAEMPQKPSGYEKIEWRYLEKGQNPKRLIEEKLLRRNNQRAKFLRSLSTPPTPQTAR